MKLESNFAALHSLLRQPCGGTRRSAEQLREGVRLIWRHPCAFRPCTFPTSNLAGAEHQQTPTMPAFGKLLGRSKTKEKEEEKQKNTHNYQPIQYKQSPSSTQPASSKSPPSTNAGPTSQQAPVTGAPDPAAANTSNGEAQRSDMSTANLSNAQAGSVESKAAPRQTKGKYTLSDFQLQRTLGTGSFGRVHLVQSKHNHRFYAIKVLKKAQVVKMKQIEHTNDERKMLQRVKHPFLITLWGTFQDSKNLYMVMDFIEGGELFSLLRKSQVCRMQPIKQHKRLTPL